MRTPLFVAQVRAYQADTPGFMPGTKRPAVREDETYG